MVRLSPGTQVYFGFKMRRVMPEGHAGPVTLSFKLAEKGPRFKIAYTKEWVWELLPFALPSGEVPDMFGYWPSLDTSKTYLPETWMRRVTEEVVVKAGVDAMGRPTTARLPVEVAYVPYWYKIGTVWDFPKPGRAGELIFSQDFAHDATAAESLPLFDLVTSFNSAQSLYIG
jgi:hypothetical protein